MNGNGNAFDPRLEGLIKQGLREAPTQEPVQQKLPPAGDVWAVAGQCTSCGAPMWFCPVAPANHNPPKPPGIYLSCPCAELAMARATDELMAYRKHQQETDQ